MVQKRTDWSIKDESQEESILERYVAFLGKQGFRQSTIEGYRGNVARYLKHVNSNEPTLQDADKFRELLRRQGVARSTQNQYAYAIRAFHEMIGEKLVVKKLSVNNSSPNFFTTYEIKSIFGSIKNLKHLAIIATLFYGALRVSELCNSDLEDLDILMRTIRIHGKGGRDATVNLSNDCIRILRQYMKIRLEISTVGPLFITEYNNRWGRNDVYAMFIRYKKIAGITKPGGVHALRHSAATIMLNNGMDLTTVQKILRHSDISTTVRYLHITDETARKKYDQCMTLV